MSLVTKSEKFFLHEFIVELWFSLFDIVRRATSNDLGMVLDVKRVEMQRCVSPGPLVTSY